MRLRCCRPTTTLGIYKQPFEAKKGRGLLPNNPQPQENSVTIQFKIPVLAASDNNAVNILSVAFIAQGPLTLSKKLGYGLSVIAV